MASRRERHELAGVPARAQGARSGRGPSGYQRPPSGSQAGHCRSDPRNGLQQRCYVHFLCNAGARPPATQGRRRRLPDRTALALRPPGRRRSPSPSARLAGALEQQISQALCAGSKRVSKRPGPSYPAAPASTINTSKSDQPSRAAQSRNSKRRTHVVRIFPNEASCLRLIAPWPVNNTRNGSDGPLYLDMQPLREQLQTALQIAAPKCSPKNYYSSS